MPYTDSLTYRGDARYPWPAPPRPAQRWGGRNSEIKPADKEVFSIQKMPLFVRCVCVVGRLDGQRVPPLAVTPYKYLTKTGIFKTVALHNNLVVLCSSHFVFYSHPHYLLTGSRYKTQGFTPPWSTRLFETHTGLNSSSTKK